MIYLRQIPRSGVLTTVLLLVVPVAHAHVTIQPKQSTTDASEKYTMRVPTEKFVPTVRVEVEFPAGLNASSFDAKPGWKIEEKKDSSGKLVSAILTGVVPVGESSMFTFTARNPGQEGKLSWKVIQVYEDGTKVEWTGPEGSKTPAPVVELKKALNP